MGVPKREVGENRVESLFKEIMAENSSNLEDIWTSKLTQIFNLKQCSPKHIIIKWSKIKENFNFCNVYLFLRQRESMNRRGSEREGDTESEAGSRLSAQSLTRGSNSQTMRSCDLSQSRKLKPTKPSRCPKIKENFKSTKRSKTLTKKGIPMSSSGFLSRDLEDQEKTVIYSKYGKK